jgi:hypothetical protein
MTPPVPAGPPTAGGGPPDSGSDAPVCGLVNESGQCLVCVFREFRQVIPGDVTQDTADR